jgi:hypothetical protein
MKLSMTIREKPMNFGVVQLHLFTYSGKEELGARRKRKSFSFAISDQSFGVYRLGSSGCSATSTRAERSQPEVAWGGTHKEECQRSGYCTSGLQPLIPNSSSDRCHTVCCRLSLLQFSDQCYGQTKLL